MNPEELQRWPGLTPAEAEKRLLAEGPNELPSQKPVGIFGLLRHVLSEPMLLLLLGGGTVYFFLGEAQDAFMLLSFVVVIIGITWYQERRTERTLAALRDLSSPRALVIRDGRQIRIAGREVVRGDIIQLQEGDRVPADAVMLVGANVLIDESLLTGESIPVRKSVGSPAQAKAQPGGDDLPFVYSGTMVVAGRGVAEVIAIGADTELGKIGRSIASIVPEETQIKKETRRLVRGFLIVGLSLCAVVILLYTIGRGDFLGGILAGLTLSMAVLPEEFPVILTIFMTLGAWRLSKKSVLTRRAEAIETLGAATVLCVDKTGTITANRMALTRLDIGSVLDDLPGRLNAPLAEEFHEIIEYASLASQRDPFDPVEKEIQRYTTLSLAGSDHIHGQWTLCREYPLTSELRALSHVWQSPDSQEYVIAAKGAPETIIDLCHLPARESEQVMKRVHDMAQDGLRVLGVAKARFHDTDLPPSQHDFGFSFIGLLGFRDPVRASAPAAIREAYSAGMRVIMITGDYPGTAKFVAAEIGLQDAGNYLTGEQLSRLEPATIQDRIRSVNVFARIVPEQKLAIVNALKMNGEIVAMTGDGVNDAPALKAAHIGIAMGERGTDVARETAALVLLKDDFASIVAAVKLGRRIYQNIRQAMGFTLAVHLPIIGLSLLPVAFGMPVALFPAHIAFLELIIDPACSIVFEAQKSDPIIMRRPPRNIKQAMISGRFIVTSLLEGLGALGASFGVYALALAQGHSGDEARTVAFVSLVLADCLLIITNLSFGRGVWSSLRAPNRPLWVVVGGALAALVILSTVPAVQGLFHFSPVQLVDLLIAVIAALVSFSWSSIVSHSAEVRELGRREPA